MLKELRLTNIVLVDFAIIPFSAGFNVLSGESGSGKSAIINALNLIAGERCDTSILRHGCDKGAVEAIFDIDQSEKELLPLLEAAGIDHESGSELFIRRDLSANGKSRAFINNQLTQLTLLKQITNNLFEMVGQHANQKLLSLDYHRLAVDLFGDLKRDVKTFKESWEKELSLREQLQQLTSSESERMRTIEICRMEIDELDEAALQEGEEEELFAEYTQLSHADELVDKTHTMLQVLSGEKNSVLPLLGRHQTTLQQLASLAPALEEVLTTYQNALIEFEEVAHTIRNFSTHIDNDPDRMTKLDERLQLINKLKKKYGNSIEEIHAYRQQRETLLAQLENADNNIEMLQEQLKHLKDENNHLAAKLTERRQHAARNLEQTIISQLRSLNMPKVEFSIEITPQKRCSTGDDRIEFFIRPNVGEHKVALRDCASGGELSRTMLALQAVLAGKEQIPTIVFDEVDANIGGETAAIVGEKLKAIGNNHQILCITHFPQVAKQAQHHLRICKKEVEGRTITCIDWLDDKTRADELARMLGEPSTQGVYGCV